MKEQSQREALCLQEQELDVVGGIVFYMCSRVWGLPFSHKSFSSYKGGTEKNWEIRLYLHQGYFKDLVAGNGWEPAEHISIGRFLCPCGLHLGEEMQSCAHRAPPCPQTLEILDRPGAYEHLERVTRKLTGKLITAKSTMNKHVYP